MRKRLVSVLAVSAMVFAACGGTQATASPAVVVSGNVAGELDGAVDRPDQRRSGVGRLQVRRRRRAHLFLARLHGPADQLDRRAHLHRHVPRRQQAVAGAGHGDRPSGCQRRRPHLDRQAARPGSSGRTAPTSPRMTSSSRSISRSRRTARTSRASAATLPSTSTASRRRIRRRSCSSSRTSSPRS